MPVFEDMIPPWIIVSGGMASFHAYFFIGEGSLLDNPKNFFETDRWKILVSGVLGTFFVTMIAVVLEIYTK